jgi:nifR3 family TIM-barrel protein
MTVSADVSPAFKVGKLPIFGDLILSPMDGFSDHPFRALARELGSSMSYLEFVNAMEVVHGHPNLERRLKFSEIERPVVFQLFDEDVDRIVDAALRLQERGPEVIDINMGCSDRRVSGRGAGAGLMRTPLKIARLFRRLSEALEVTLSGKIRLGWDHDSRNYMLVARIIEENGGQLVAVHGRTRQDGYGSEAEWEPIAEVKSALSVPVVGNGDVRTVADIERMKRFTGCDAVMIGRGAIGNPWIFSRLDRDQVPAERVYNTMTRHLESMMDFYGAVQGLVLFRKHVVRYLKPHTEAGTGKLPRRLLTTEEPEEFKALLRTIVYRDRG